MRQNPVGEPAATAAWNFGTPRRRSSLKRLGPFCHCRQRYERSLRRSIEIAPKLAEIIARELGRDAAWQAGQIEEYRAMAKNYVLQ